MERHRAYYYLQAVGTQLVHCIIGGMPVHETEVNQVDRRDAADMIQGLMVIANDLIAEISKMLSFAQIESH